MTWKTVTALCSLSALLQVAVWAQINCYPNALCGADGSSPIEVSSASDCCIQAIPITRSFHPSTGGSCQPCIVIGFSAERMEIYENNPDPLKIQVELITSTDGLSSSVLLSMLDITVELNQMLTTATFGVDFSFHNYSETTVTSHTRLSYLPSTILRVSPIDDLVPGEAEQFVLEMTSALVTDLTTKSVTEVLVSNSMSVVVIHDNDVIQVEFQDKEYSIDESVGKRQIHFIITNPVIVDTHLLVLALTYKEFDDQYEVLNATYPGLDPFTLNNEYDQAESDDFSPKRIPFTIRANSTIPDRDILFTVSDDTFEPVEEGFRLVIVVDESRTPRSQVSFVTERQVALFRIVDYTDTLTIGFLNAEQYTHDGEGTQDVYLPLAVRGNNTTEITVFLNFAVGSETTAQVYEDFNDFTEGQVELSPPNIFSPPAPFLVIIHYDDILEGEEQLVVALGRPNRLMLPEPFSSDKLASPPRSMVKPPEDARIIFDFPSTKILITDSDTFVGFLNTPYQVQESAGSLIVMVGVISGQLVSGLSLLLSTVDDTATDGDYSQLTNYTIFLSAIISSAQVSITIIDDTKVESNEQLLQHLELMQVSNEVSVTVNNVPVVIMDDDYPESLFFQLKGGYFAPCTNWDHSTESSVDSFIQSKLVSVLRHSCQCDFQKTFISPAMLLCQENDPTQIIYRASITEYDAIPATKLVGFIEEWVQQGATITNGITVVTFDSDCPVRISNIDEPVCGQIPPITASSPSASTNPPSSDTSSTCTIIASGVTVLVIITAVIIAVIAVFGCFVKHRKRKSSPSETQIDKIQKFEMAKCIAYGDPGPSNMSEAKKLAAKERSGSTENIYEAVSDD